MKPITVNRKELLRIASFAAIVNPTRTTAPAASCVLMDFSNGKIKIRATDFSYFTEASCEANFDEPTAFGVPSAALIHFLSMSEGEEVTISDNNARKKFSCGKDVANLGFISAGEFPVREVNNPKVSIVVSSELLSHKLSQVSYAMLDDETRPSLKSTLFSFSGSAFDLVATDGRRMSIATIPNVQCEKSQFVVPREFIQLLNKCLDDGDVTIAISDLSISVTGEDWSLSGPLIDEQFPNYQNSIPNCTGSLNVNREELIKSLKMSLGFCDTNNSRVEIDGSPDGILVQAAATNGWKRELEGKSDPVKFAVNQKFLLSILESVRTDMVKIEFGDPISFMIIRDEHFLGVFGTLRR